MGQMTYAVMLGAKMSEDPPEAFADGWYTLFGGYKPGKSGPEPDMNEEADVLGFFVAVGAGGKDGVPYLEDGFALDGIRSVKAYEKRIAACEKAWPKFEKHAKAKGIVLGEPRLWLRQTEVA